MSEWDYSEYNEFNRFTNLDGIEAKIIEHLINSNSKHAQVFWKVLKYNDYNALTQADVSRSDRLKLVNNENGESTGKRLFLFPRDNNAQGEQCSSVYVYLETIIPQDQTRAIVGVTVETNTYPQIGVVAGDGDPDFADPDQPYAINPNESDEQGSIVVPFKNRETVLVKSILAELNGLYIDGIGYLMLNTFKVGENVRGIVDLPYNRRNDSYGHRINFKIEMSGISGTSEIGY